MWPGSDEALEFCSKWLTWGAGPRAGLNLVLAAKAEALKASEKQVREYAGSRIVGTKQGEHEDEAAYKRRITLNGDSASTNSSGSWT